MTCVHLPMTAFRKFCHHVANALRPRLAFVWSFSISLMDGLSHSHGNVVGNSAYGKCPYTQQGWCDRLTSSHSLSFNGATSHLGIRPSLSTSVFVHAAYLPISCICSFSLGSCQLVEHASGRVLLPKCWWARWREHRLGVLSSADWIWRSEKSGRIPKNLPVPRLKEQRPTMKCKKIQKRRKRRRRRTMTKSVGSASS